MDRKKRPTLDEAKKRDLVDYLATLGHHPLRVTGVDHWYLSPIRTEKTASFKVDRKKNLWYDFGIGQGGNLITFGMRYFNCTLPEFLDKMAGNIGTISAEIISPEQLTPPPLPQHDRIQISGIYAIRSTALLNYIRQRRIPLHIADLYCKEICYQIDGKNYFGIGFETDSHSFEIRNPFAKLTTPPKSITSMDNGGNTVYVFEGFFDFLTFLTIYPEHVDFPRDYVILNSVNQFEKARDFMENHAFVKLFLDRDSMGKNYTAYACSISPLYADESQLYEGYKDLNDWLVNFGNSRKDVIAGKT